MIDYSQFLPQDEEDDSEKPYDSISPRDPIAQAADESAALSDPGLVPGPQLAQNEPGRDPASYVSSPDRSLDPNMVNPADWTLLINQMQNGGAASAPQPTATEAVRQAVLKRRPMSKVTYTKPMNLSARPFKKPAPKPASPLSNQSSMQISLRGPSGQPQPQAAAPTPAGGIGSDEIQALLDQYQNSEGDVNDFRKAQAQSYYIQNMGNSAAQAAQGPQTPQINNQLYSNLQRQNEGFGSSVNQDLNRRQAIARAILLRNGAAGIAKPQSPYQQGIQNRFDEMMKYRQSQQDIAKTNTKNANDLKTANYGQKVVKGITSDPVVSKSEINLASLQKSLNLLNNKDIPVTPQVLSDAEQDIASAMNLRGMGATEGKINRTELQTLSRIVATAKQKWLNQPNIDLRKEDPQLVQTIQGLNQALADDYHTTIGQRKNQLMGQHESVFDPNSGGAMDKALQGRLKGIRNNMVPSPAPQGGNSVFRVKDPKGVIRLIPKYHLQDAIDAGGQVIQ